LSLPAAHEYWFVDGVPDRDWSFATEPRTLLLLALAVLATLGVRALARLRDGIDVPVLARLAPWMPFAVRIHLAVALVGLVSAGFYLAPTMELGHGVGGVLLGILVVGAAVLLVVGLKVRLAALLLVAAGPVGVAVYGFDPVVQRLDVLGLALFLFFAGAGRWSADAERGGIADVPVEQLGRAVWCLRVCAGLALIVVAFAEKLANPELAQQFLASQEVDFNVAEAIGLPVDDLEFIRIAGAVEVLFGLLLISGALPQLIVLIAGIPFNATLYFFGTIELLGHLPVYAAMLVLLVYGSHPELRPWVSRLWPWSARPHRAPAPA
jgi:uncharacterized membrane protein YphA (DoxX/SURF4 family)